jgi:hypothetical protein
MEVKRAFATYHRIPKWVRHDAVGGGIGGNLTGI